MKGFIALILNTLYNPGYKVIQGVQGELNEPFPKLQFIVETSNLLPGFWDICLMTVQLY